MLDRMDLDRVPDGSETWEKVVRKLRGGMMPPLGAPRPDQASIESLISFLETTIDHAALAKPDPGRSPLHRLNRSEYANAIATCSRSTSTRPPFSPPTMRRTGSTTSRTS
jgi:hypothetical protein